VPAGSAASIENLKEQQMPITVFSRYSGSSRDAFVAVAKQAKPILEKAGADMVRLGQLHTGPHAGDLLAAIRYPSWETYGKAQQSLSSDSAFQALYSQVASHLADRIVVVGIDL
jgi:hypothetical protein